MFKHIDRLKAQIQYITPSIFASGIAFLISGFTTKYGLKINILISLGTGIILSFLILTLLNKRKKN